MLSKCLNPHCSETFQYLGRGRLFRVDFSESERKVAPASKRAPVRNKTNLIEHFWLCENCAAKMTIDFTESGEVRAVPIEKPNPLSVRQPHRVREAAAS
jgi:hypothetical protein